MKTVLDEILMEQELFREFENNLDCGCTACRATEAEEWNMEYKTGTNRAINSFTCNNIELAEVRRILGNNAITYAQLQNEVNRRARMAADWCIKAALELERKPIDSGVRRIFINVFRVRPEFAAEWLKRQGWNSRGALIAHRLRTIAKILTDRSIRYFCWGNSSYCPECTGSNSDYFACSSWGKSRVICIGTSFWEAWKAGKVSDNISTLIHEAFHIYFGLLIRHGENAGGKFSDANCYTYFILRLNRKPVPDRIKTRCNSTSVR